MSAEVAMSLFDLPVVTVCDVLGGAAAVSIESRVVSADGRAEAGDRAARAPRSRRASRDDRAGEAAHRQLAQVAAQAPGQSVGVHASRRPANADGKAELAIVVVDPQGRVLGADASFLRLTGYARDDVEGQDFRRVIIFDDLLDEPDLLRGPQRTTSGWYVEQRGTRSRATFTLAPVIEDQNTLAALTIVIWPRRVAPRSPCPGAPARAPRRREPERATSDPQTFAEAR